MPIHPLPQFEDDLKAQEEERRAIEALKPPKTIVVRFGVMGMIGEFPYRGDATPGCGSKIVVRTQRGVEVGEMLTSTCPNAGCSKSVSREQMLDYIDASGGRQYPFYTNGRALRVATVEDMQRQEQIDSTKKQLRDQAREIAIRLGLPVKVVEIEPILSGDRTTVYYASDDRIDVRPLMQELSSLWQVRIDMRQVGARDEARLVADYERCGQYCCCKNFLKVLKPISMKAAKTQKATLDPLKISGRCGRLMCCLRYEEQTYDELRKKLPRRKTRVGTPEGDGIVVDSQILTQLVLVRLDDGNQVAVPVEELVEPGQQPRPQEPAVRAPEADHSEDDAARRRRRRRRKPPAQDAAEQSSEAGEATDRPKRRRRRRRSGSGGPSGGASASGGASDATSSDAPPSSESSSDGTPRRKRRRRRRRRPEGGSNDSGSGSH